MREANALREEYGDLKDIAVISSRPSPFETALKRGFDVVFASLGLLALLPFFVIIGFLIKLDSKGPVIFRQERIGKNGRKFIFFKFRTMADGAAREENIRAKKLEEFIKGIYFVEKSRSTKIVDSSKITRVGRFLRKTSFDEMPQLVNVLKGEMSLVGPRPCLPYEWECYQDWHRLRLSITPGCTGLWQVAGRSRVSFQDMVMMDISYINNYSFFTDVKLILKTIPVMLLGRGAK
jgi:lipopolysaccharide/colanic/teichoic acid biosynthesis glycosyltransferase